MGKPWRRADYMDRLPETYVRPTEPQTDPPEWVEGVLAALVVAIAIAVVLASILSAPVLSR